MNIRLKTPVSLIRDASIAPQPPSQIPFYARPAACLPSDVLAAGPGGKRVSGRGRGLSLTVRRSLNGSPFNAPMDRREAAHHPSAERYRDRAKLARRAADLESNADERSKLIDLARHYEELATSLERVRVKRWLP